MSATVRPGKMEAEMLRELGFSTTITKKRARTHSYIIHRAPVNRPTVKYVTRILERAMNGPTYPEFYWLVPQNAQSPLDIPKRIIACGTIALATSLMAFVDSLLPRDFTDRDQVSLPYHAVVPADDCRKNIQAFDDPESSTRLLLATDSLANGINTKASSVVVVFQEESFENMIQWLGRVSRGDEPGESIIYAPAWMRLPPANKPPSATLTKQAELRSHVDPAFVHFHNPTENRCPRWAVSNAFSEPYRAPDEPLECCSFHHPDNSYLIENEKRANALAAVTHPDGQPPIRSDGTFPPLRTADQKKEARSELKRWRICVTGSMLVAHSVTPPSTILPDHLVTRLVTKLHCITTKERMLAVLHDWYNGWAMAFATDLFAFCFDLMTKLSQPTLSAPETDLNAPTVAVPVSGAMQNAEANPTARSVDVDMHDAAPTERPDIRSHQSTPPPDPVALTPMHNTPCRKTASIQSYGTKRKAASSTAAQSPKRKRANEGKEDHTPPRTISKNPAIQLRRSTRIVEKR